MESSLPLSQAFRFLFYGVDLFRDFHTVFETAPENFRTTSLRCGGSAIEFPAALFVCCKVTQRAPFPRHDRGSVWHLSSLGVRIRRRRRHFISNENYLLVLIQHAALVFPTEEGHFCRLQLRR